MATKKPMNKGLKFGLIFATLGVVGVGAYFLINKLKKAKAKKKADAEALAKSNSTTKTSSSSSSSSSSSGSSSSGGSSSSFSFPFKTKTEGDRFRRWINKYYPNYAKSIKLDESGELNSYVDTAYKKYGKAYQDAISGSGNYAPKTSTTKKYVYVKGSYANVRSSAEVNNTNKLLADFYTNRIGVVRGKGKKIGVYLRAVGDKQGSGYKWYKVTLSVNFGNAKYGYVREDTAYIK